MSDLWQKIIDSLSSNEDGGLNSIAALAKKEGEQVYSTLLSVLPQLEFSPEDAKKNWNRIVEYKEKLEAKLEHTLSLMTAVCYYFSNVEKINTPAIIELKTLEETKK
jgi:hypothetical protein